MEDPDPRVSGSGFQTLREAGIDVETCVEEERARLLNRAYLHYLRTGRSLLKLKLAVSLDGRIAAADGTSRWITGEAARARVSLMRSDSSAVMVGAGTARADNPSLLPAAGAGIEGWPARIVVSSTGRLDTGAALFDGTAPLIAALPAGIPTETAELLRNAGAEVWEIPRGGCGIDLEALLRRTASGGFGRILCEGGAGLATSLLLAGLVDEIAFFVAPVLLGGDGLALGSLGVDTIGGAMRLEGVEQTRLGDDLLMEGRLVHRAG
jgi:diaminohydroxyphosphoribosylaminopyrimidine deaminase/5-amino-6-(5-phosphoribosylamino)uracil reductase